MLMPGGAKCLAKALTTQVLMERRGHQCEFKLGVAKNEQGELEAHAWIERLWDFCPIWIGLPVYRPYKKSAENREQT